MSQSALPTNTTPPKARSLGRSSFVFAGMTLISRFLGLARDVLIARYFDAHITDPFFAALRIPNTLRRFFAEGGFANAFIPVLAQTKAEDEQLNQNNLPNLIAHTTGTLLTALIIISALGVIFSGSILLLVAQGLSEKPEQLLLGEEMLAIMFPYILLISLTALAGGILNTFERFAIPALTPALLNIALLLACLWRAFHEESSGVELAWAVLWGGVAQLSLQIPFLIKLKLLKRPRLAKHEGVGRILRLMLPTLFGSSVSQLTVLVNTLLASSLMTGSISWLYYADRLVELPVALIGVALGTVILPKLSSLKSDPDPKRFEQTLSWAWQWALILGSAAAVGLVCLAKPLMQSLFQYGAFSVHDAEQSALALQVYGLGAGFMIIIKVLAPAFYARQDTKTPVKAGLIAMGVNLILAVMLVQPFAHLGLAAATALSSLVNMVLLNAFLRHHTTLRPPKLFYAQILIANLIMACALISSQNTLAHYFTAASWQRFTALLALITLGLLCYGASLYLLGLRPHHLRLAKD
ncbi:MAG: murein biosynthesis integral membrane protein MurJ [Cardiobacteriaceae bacterium]|nr:murein biosynthesis integral membrane protein MurJ [Cardiobacteriaceae bacterium]